jgi:hypothetical protein
MKKKYIVGGVITLALVLCFTPYYSITLFGLLFWASIRRPFASALFDSYFSRLILNLLIMSALIMVTGLYSWAISIPFHAIYAVIAFGLYYYLTIGRIKREDTGPNSIINRKDALSIALALIAIVIVCLSSYTPQASTAASIQRIATGYDNIAHYSLLQTTYEANGFVYGPLKEVSAQTITALNNYPQGWHLATSTLLKGFGGQLFEPSSLLLTFNIYLVVLYLWYFITVFLFTRVSLAVLDSIKVKVQRRSIGFVSAFSAANILIQLLVFWGALNLGFASFLPSIAYLVLLAWLVLSLRDSNEHAIHKVFLMLLAIAATAEVWLLPVPAAGLVIVLALMPFVTKTTKTWVIAHKRIAGAYLAAGVLLLLPILIQAYIYKAYALEGTSELLNNDGGIFPISNTISCVLFIFTVAAIVAYKPIKNYLRDSFTIIVLPVLFLSIFVFIYQIFVTEKTTYYYIKLLGLALCLLGLFFVPLYATLISQIKFRQNQSLLLCLLSIGVIGGLITTGGQTTIEINGFVQQNSKVEYQTAVQLAKFAGDGFKYPTVILRGKSHAEDSDGTYFANRMIHNEMVGTCEADVNYRENFTLDRRIKELVRCSKQHTIRVIASNKTYPRLSKLQSPNLIVINVP